MHKRRKQNIVSDDLHNVLTPCIPQGVGRGLRPGYKGMKQQKGRHRWHMLYNNTTTPQIPVYRPYIHYLDR